jgi:Beta/Gamma crystallin
MTDASPAATFVGAPIQPAITPEGMIRTALILLTVTLAPARAVAAPCEVFEHKNFAGQSVMIERNQSLPRLGALNDRVSSIAPQCLMVAYADEEYHGTTTTFGPGEYATLSDGWDNEIPSLHCNCR